MKKALLLIHGLFTNELVMKYLEKKFVDKNYKVYQFNYNSFKYSEKTLKAFHNYLCYIKSENVKEISIIGHSLGGLLARNYIHTFNDYPVEIKSLVTIGTPHNQSQCAQNVMNSIFKNFLGSSGDSGLTIRLSPWTSSIPLGCIAGKHTSVIGANFFLLNKRNLGDNDGTVFVEEAILENCQDNIVLPGSHTGLLFKPYVFEQCLNFVEKNKFNKEVS